MMPTVQLPCPECGRINWRQDEHYHATDRNYMDWDDTHQQYDFTFQQRSTSDHEHEDWICENGHVAPDEIAEALEEAT